MLSFMSKWISLGTTNNLPYFKKTFKYAATTSPNTAINLELLLVSSNSDNVVAQVKCQEQMQQIIKKGGTC